MSKPSQRQLAAEYQLSPYVVCKLNEQGVDIYDKDAVAKEIMSRRTQPKAWIKGPPWEDEPEKEKPKQTGERDLFKELDQMAQDDYNGSRTLKTQIDAKHKLRQIAILESEYVHREDVINDMERIARANQAAHKKCSADLPAMLEGLSAPEMKAKIKEYMIKIDTQLSDEMDKLYNTQEWD
jgi:hypothetical protein